MANGSCILDTTTVPKVVQMCISHLRYCSLGTSPLISPEKRGLEVCERDYRY